MSATRSKLGLLTVSLTAFLQPMSSARVRSNVWPSIDWMIIGLVVGFQVQRVEETSQYN
jgi:hypothetical protein